MTFFAASNDMTLLRQAAREIAPRAARMVGTLLATEAGDDAVPPPADLHPARESATQDEALKTLRATDDFSLLQAMARTIGRRIEALEIVASAEFPEGARVVVPAAPGGKPMTGTVESTGTLLMVILDDGETWEGPPSSARLEGRQ